MIEIEKLQCVCDELESALSSLQIENSCRAAAYLGKSIYILEEILKDNQNQDDVEE